MSSPSGNREHGLRRRPTFVVQQHDARTMHYDFRLEAGDGAGPVIVWDTGTYENQTTDSSGHLVDVPDAIERGHVSFDLHGRKLRGGFALTRIRSGRDPGWLLVKKDDKFASAQADPERDEPESVRSGQDIGQLSEGTS